MLSYRVRRAYARAYEDPIRFKAGDPLTLLRWDDEYPGWVWCRHPSGLEGWVHEQFLVVDGTTGLAVRAYSALELSVREGEVVEGVEEVGGWIWCVNAHGEAGWVPADHLEAAQSPSITYRVSPAVSDEALNELFEAAWEAHQPRDFGPVLSRSLAYVCAYHGERLVGFVNLAWDGGLHGFVLDATVHPDYRRRGIGKALLDIAAITAQQQGLEWLHADFEPRHESFYRRCGFTPTPAGLRRLKRP